MLIAINYLDLGENWFSSISLKIISTIINYPVLNYAYHTIIKIKGIGAMVALVYAHVGYPLSATCLEPLKGKIPVESILRVEVGQRSSDLLTPYLERHYHQIAQTCSEEGYDPLDEEFVPANATQLRQQQMDLFESKVPFCF